MKPEVYVQLTDMLCELERHLRELSLWADVALSAHQLASTEPFCVDTLSFPEWLQFIFLPRMSVIIEAQIPLPAKSQIAPMAEEFFQGQLVNGAQVCAVLLRFDKLIGMAGEDRV